MTIVVVNQAGGADFTDLQTAIDAAPATLTEIYEIRLEPGDYNGDIVVPARSGESVNNYIKITHTPGNHATGFGLGTHITSSDGGHTNTINGNFVVYEGISITNASISGNSDEAFRLLGTELLLQRCFVDAENEIRQQDAVYFGGPGDQAVTLSNCAIRGFSRSSVNIQRRSKTIASIYDLDLFHNTFIDNGIQATNEDDCGGVSIDVTRNPSANLPISAVVANINAYNNIVINTQGFNTRANADTTIDVLAMEWRNLSGADSNEELATYNWTGGGNVSGQDDSAQDKFGVADNFVNIGLVDTAPVSGENVFVTDIAANDYSIAGENANTITQNGISIPTPADPRVELAVDILGNVRSAIGTIGAFQFGTSPVPVETVRGLTSFVSLSDSPESQRHYSYLARNTLVALDASGIARYATSKASSILGVTDTHLASTVRQVSTASALRVSDVLNAAAYQSILRMFTDTVLLATTGTASRGREQLLAESVDMEGGVDVARKHAQLLIESVDMAALVNDQRFFFRAQSSALSVFDSTISELAARVVELFLLDGLATVDRLTVDRDYFKSILSSASLGDSVGSGVTLSNIIERALSDLASISDNAQVDRELMVNLVSDVRLLDTTTRVLLLQKVISDNALIDDNVLIDKQFIRSMLASVVITDAITHQLKIVTLLSDSAAVVDAVSGAATLLHARALVDALGVSDSVALDIVGFLIELGVIIVDVEHHTTITGVR